MNPDDPQAPQPGLLGRISAAIQNKLFTGAAPSGLTGLLSPDDIQAAKKNAMTHLGLSLLANSEGAPGKPAPNVASAIGQAGLGAQEQYGQNVQGAVAGQQQALQANWAKHLMALRQQVAQQFPQAPGETPQQQLMRIEQMAAAYAQGGDTETSAKLTQLAESIRKMAGTPELSNNGQRRLLVNPITGEQKDLGPMGLTPNDILTDQRARQAHQDAIKQQELEFQALQGYRGIQTGESLSKNFDKTVAAEAKTADTMRTVQANLDAARAGDPVASKNLLISLNALADPRAQIRQGVINLMLNPNQSIQMKLSQAYSLAAQGKLPPQLLDQIAALVQQHAQAARSSYDRKYQAMTKRYPQAADQFRTSDEVFGPPAGAEDPADSLLKKYGIPPRDSTK